MSTVEAPLVAELAVGELAVSLGFYRDILGFDVRYSRPEEGFAFVELQGCQLMLDQIGLGRTWETAPLQRPLGRGLNLQMRVNDLDDLLARVTAAGVSLFLPLETRNYVVSGKTVAQRQFCVQDPDGYLLRFCER